MIQLVPESTSIVLRATHILLVRVDAAQMGEWVLQTTGLRRSLDGTLTLMEVFKGTVQQSVGDQFVVKTEQFRISTLWLMPIPGVWSEQPLDPGTQLVAFCRTDGTDAAEIIKDPFCEKLIVAGSALLDVRLAFQAETQHLTLPALYERFQPNAASLTYLFTEYLWAAYGTDAMHNAEQFEALLRFLEEPNLGPVARLTLLTPIYSMFLTGTIDAALLNRFVITLFHLLRLPNAGSLHDNIVGTYLPNVLGLHAGIAVKAAADVLKDYPEERATLDETLRNYSGGSPTAPLVGWLKGEQ